jgi:hypothetical protein
MSVQYSASFILLYTKKDWRGISRFYFSINVIVLSLPLLEPTAFLRLCQESASSPLGSRSFVLYQRKVGLSKGGSERVVFSYKEKESKVVPVTGRGGL